MLRAGPTAEHMRQRSTRTHSARAKYEARKTAYTIILTSRTISHDGSHLRHRLNSNYAFDSEVGLISKASGKVIRAELVAWNEGVCDQILSPLVEQVVLDSDSMVRHASNISLNTHVRSHKRVIIGPLGVAQSHDEHITAL